MLLIRHLGRLVADIVAFGIAGGARTAALLVIVGAPLILVFGLIKVAGWAVLYPFL